MVIFRGGDGDGETFYLVTIIPFCSELILIRDQWISSDAIVWSEKRQNTLSASRLSTALARKDPLLIIFYVNTLDKTCSSVGQIC